MSDPGPSPQRPHERGRHHRAAGRPGRDSSARDRAGSSDASGAPRGRKQWGSYRPAAPDAPRRAAFDTLCAVASRDAYANLILPGILRERGITGRDAAFATELTYGTLRAQGTLDAVLHQCASRPLDQVDLRVLQMLRLGAYQLLRMRVPEHAAVAATVEVARVALTDGPARFVNAVLRRVAEHDEDWWLEAVCPPRASDPVGHLAVRYSHPEWVVRAFADALGEGGEELAGPGSQTAAALAADNERPPVHLAARPGRMERDRLATEAGGEIGPYSPYAVRLDAGGDPADLRAVTSGCAQVQDEGSQLAALALLAAPLDGPDERWLDLCAGPGGKAGLLAPLAVARGAHLTAVEIAEHRAAMTARAVAGTGTHVLAADGREVGRDPSLPEGRFDRVLVDAPCTGLGALRRRPESRWRRRPADVPALTRLQRELLLAALRAVRPGGVVAYVVCSPHVAETRVTVADVVRRTGAVPVDTRPLLSGVPDLGAGPGVQLWPHRHGTDAMFIAVLRLLA